MYVNLFVLLLGGGFGGKETRSCMFSTALAVAANKWVVGMSIVALKF